MNTILTFLIPCYNVGDCVRRCVESMTVPEILDRTEILLVNDGSKDNTLEVLRQFEKKYPETVRIIDKANGGWGTAINLGIAEAKGKYVKEVDADDWVSSENLKAFVDYLEQTEADLVATEYTEYHAADNRYEPHTYDEDMYGQELKLGEFWDKYPDGWRFPIHAITYRTQMLRDMKLRVGDRYYGDFEYFSYPQPHIKSLIVLPMNITVYYRGIGGQSTSREGYAKHYRDMAGLSLRMVHFYGTLPEGLHPLCREHLRQAIVGTVTLSYELMMSPSYAGRKEGIRKELKQYDKKLKTTSSLFYQAAGTTKKKGIHYIRIWRATGINLLQIHR